VIASGYRRPGNRKFVPSYSWPQAVRSSTTGEPAARSSHHLRQPSRDGAKGDYGPGSFGPPEQALWGGLEKCFDHVAHATVMRARGELRGARF
jgi:hypothetical protein